MNKIKLGKSTNTALKIGGIYLIFGLLWIFFSDKFLESFAFSIDTLSTFQTYKGFFFIFISTLFIALVVYFYNTKLRDKIDNYKDFFDLNPDPVIVLGYFDFEIIRVNKTFRDIFKFSFTASPKLYLIDLIADKSGFDIDVLKKELALIRKLKGKRFNWVFQDSEKKAIDVCVMARPSVYKNRDVIFLVIRPEYETQEEENNLTIQKTFLENAFDNIPVGIHILKKENDRYYTSYANKEARNIFNSENISEKEIADIKFINKNSEVIGFSSLPFIRILNNDIRFFDDEVTIQYQERNFNILLRASAVVNPEGQTIACVSVLRNVTNLKEKENAFKQYEAKYRTIVETSPDAILIFDSITGKITDFNKKALYLFKLKPTEIVEKSFTDLTPDLQPEGTKSNEKIQRYIQATLKGGTPFFEWSHKNKYGELFSCEVSMAKIPSEEGDFIKCTIIDVSDRTLAEDMLNKTEKIYEEVISSVTNNITVHDASTGLVLEANKTFYNTFMYDFKDIESMSITEIYASEKHYDKNAFIEKIKKVLMDKELRFRWKSFNKEKKEIWLDLMLKHIEIDGENRIVAISKNVNEIVTVQQELIELTKSLKEKNEEFLHILYTATHDLRTPLLNILGFSNELKLNYAEIVALLEEKNYFDMEDLKELIQNDCENNITTIVDNTRKMSILINGLLEISRIETFDIKKEEINVSGLIKEVKKNMEYKIEETGIDFLIEKLPNCYTDKYKLQQIFVNLIDNAIKFRKKEGNSFVKVYGELKGEKLFYSVEDNGIGIESKNIDKVLEMFYRNDPETAEGAGLGLAVVEKALDTIGGELSIESTRDKGSKFTITIPYFCYN